jgi:Pyridoxamine 5''-phosphate oxidase.
MEITNLGKADGLPPVDWAAVAEKLDAGSAPAPDAANSRTTWLSTVNEDGSPHVTAVGALWLDGTFWFQTGAGTRKGRNVARDPRCSIAVSIRDADVVIEGDAARVTEPGAVARIAKAWADERLAGRTRRQRVGDHCPVQRTVARTTAVERVSH